MTNEGKICFSIPSNSFRKQYCKCCALTSESIVAWALLGIQNKLQVCVYRTKHKISCGYVEYCNFV